MSESVILCEGYHDRAFWAGWLTHFGCTDPGEQPGKVDRIPVKDPWGITVARGHFAYHSPSGKFVRITPCHGKNNVLPAAGSRLKDRQGKPLTRLVISTDSDVVAAPAADTGAVPGYQAVEELLKEFGSPPKNEHGEFVLDDGATIISVVQWQAEDAPAPGLPEKQTLERLACAALVAAFPERGQAVRHWLDSRPGALAAGPKEHSWSHMAGWYAEFGCDAFYRKLWLEDRVAEQLRLRLTNSGAWRVAEALAE